MEKECTCKSKKEKHNKHYYEEGRNGWTPSSTHSTINPKMLLSKEELESGSDYDIDTFGRELFKINREITELLINKNKAYGNTALNPINIFSKLNSTEAICARIDDKLARIKNKGINDATEDTVNDLIGYLLLLKMSI